MWPYPRNTPRPAAPFSHAWFQRARGAGVGVAPAGAMSAGAMPAERGAWVGALRALASLANVQNAPVNARNTPGLSSNANTNWNADYKRGYEIGCRQARSPVGFRIPTGNADYVNGIHDGFDACWNPLNPFHDPNKADVSPTAPGPTVMPSGADSSAAPPPERSPYTPVYGNRQNAPSGPASYGAYGAPAFPYGVRGPADRQMETVDQLLARCPSPQEIQRIRSQYNISFPNYSPPSWTCTDNGSESSDMLSVINAFRLADAIVFDAPIPLLGTRTLGQYLRPLQINWAFAIGQPYSNGGVDPKTGERHVMIRAERLSDPSQRVWVDPRSGTGLSGLLTIMVHEARHTQGFGHTMCPDASDSSLTYGSDSSLTYGGAWAAQYWWNIWLGTHSSAYLTQDEKNDALGEASWIMKQRFCDRLSRAAVPLLGGRPFTPSTITSVPPALIALGVFR